MKTFRISIAIDGILSFIISFVLFFCIFRVIKLNFSMTIILALVCSFCFCILTVNTKLQSAKRKTLTAIKSREKRLLAEKLSFLSDKEIIDLFCIIFEKKKIEFSYDNYSIKACCKKFIFKFLPQELSVNELCEMTKNCKDKANLVVSSTTFSTASISFAATNSIKLIAIDEVYNLIKKQFPEFLNCSIQNNKKRKINFRLLMNKKNSFKFIFYGICLDLFSLLAIYPVYYVISGTIFILIGIISFFFGYLPQAISESFDDLLKK